MKIRVEEIIKRFPQESAPTRWRRSVIGTFDFPEALYPIIQVGHVLTMDRGGQRLATRGPRDERVIANIRVAVLDDVEHIGLIIDLITPELFAWLKKDLDAPDDYAAFCKQEGIES